MKSITKWVEDTRKHFKDMRGEFEEKIWDDLKEKRYGLKQLHREGDNISDLEDEGLLEKQAIRDVMQALISYGQTLSSWPPPATLRRLRRQECYLYTLICIETP